jgi:hypothetical protein
MTDLVAPSSMDASGSGGTEHWHASVMRGGLISSVVVARDAAGTWTARTQLRDRALHPKGDGWKSGPCDSREAAFHAGQAAALRLHKALVGTHEVPEPPRTIAMLEPDGGYRSRALRQFAYAQASAQALRSTPAAPQRAAEAERIA